MKVIKILFLLILISLISSIFVSGLLWAKWNYIDLPTVKELRNYRPPLVTEIYDSKGNIIGEFAAERRIYVPIEKIPKHVQLAFLAAEDSRFYEHKGLDYRAIIRAILVDIKERRFAQGASTITMQVARNMFLTQEKTITRKIKEMLLAKKLEETLPKKKILELYLNIIFLGHNSYGVEAASRTYFGKSVSQLTLSEAALLAGLPKAPTAFSPVFNPQRALERRNWVLSRMLEEGFITKAEYEKAVKEPLNVKKEYAQRTNIAPYLMDMLFKELSDLYGRDMVLKGGLKIYTTIDRDIQLQAEKALKEGIISIEKRVGNIPKDQPYEYSWCKVKEVSANQVLCSYNGKDYILPQAEFERIPTKGNFIKVWMDKSKRLRVWKEPKLNGALVAIDLNTMGIITLVGGYDYNISQFNRAVQAKRQPGSAFKPIVYAAAIENGYTPYTRVIDEPVTYTNPWAKDPRQSVWSPANYDNKYLGPMPLWYALALSRNTVTVKLAEQIGMDKVAEMAKRLGITTPIKLELASALGASEVRVIELVTAFIPFAKEGLLCKPYYITKIVDSRGNIIFEQKGPNCIQVIDKKVANDVLFMLMKVVETGTGRLAKSIGRVSAGKTGTSSEYRDAWYIGFTPNVIAGVFIGRDNFQPIGKNFTGSVAALPIWVNFMKSVVARYPDVLFSIMKKEEIPQVKDNETETIEIKTIEEPKERITPTEAD